MANSEDIEKVRQEIMRFRELPNIMRKNLEDRERAYAKLFVRFSAEEIAATGKKDLHWQAAEKMLPDVSPLRNAVGLMRFGARNLEYAFEELPDIIVTVQDPE